MGVCPLSFLNRHLPVRGQDLNRERKPAATNKVSSIILDRISQILTPSKAKSYWGIKKEARTVTAAQIEKIIFNLLFDNPNLSMTIFAHPRLWVIPDESLCSGGFQIGHIDDLLVGVALNLFHEF